MRTLYVFAIALSVVFAIVVFYVVDEFWRMMWLSNNLYSWVLTSTLIIQSFNAFYILLFSFTLKHIKTTTALVLSIIGLSLTGIMFLLNMISFVDAYSFLDITPFHIFLAPVLLAFSIVNLVQANIYLKKGLVRVNDKTIDDLV